MSVRPITRFTVLSVIWGSAFASVRLGTGFFPPVLYAALCFGVAGAVLLMGIHLQYGQWLPSNDAARRVIGIIAALMVLVYNTLFFTGQQSTPSAVGAIILSFIPIITAIFAAVLLREHQFGLIDVIGVGFGIAGVWIVVGAPTGMVVGGDLIPRLLILGAACATALGSVLVERLSPRDPFPILLAWGITLGAAGLLALSSILGEIASVNWEIGGLLAVLYLGLVVNVGGYLLYFSLLFEVGAFETNLINYALPITATVWGAVIFGEVPEPTTLSGALAIALGFSVLKRTEIRALISTWTSNTDD